MNAQIFCGCIPALVTPTEGSKSQLRALVKKGKELTDAGMSGVVYCGSMGDWPLLTDAQRQEGVRQLVDAGVRVIVGTGAQNSAIAADHAAHAQSVGAHGLMVIPQSCRWHLAGHSTGSLCPDLVGRTPICPRSSTTALTTVSRPRRNCSWIFAVSFRTW